MASYSKNVAIIGASGNVGKIILGSLVASSQFGITVISRKESEATFPPGVTVLKTDYSGKGLEVAFKGQDVVISAVGASAFGEQKKFVDAAICAGVRRFIPSEFSANSQNDAVLQLQPLFGPKKELVEYLKSKEADGLTWTGLANGFLEFDVASHTATIWDGGNKSFTLTNQKALVNEAVKKLAAGDFNGAFVLVRATVFGNTPGLHSNYAKEENLANNVLGLHLETVSDVVQRVLNE
ncbi:hypothetical protein N7463_000553 [Penicillium fimorum]|uniref:NmrA-like domain-containing protein n=1 Tax=Penicillium fimorum TaxID=1882269 RepID=A0A9W9Y4H9_9EURO|nr:hypothetical protein N7463_000553 [Penicillium fimorum]